MTTISRHGQIRLVLLVLLAAALACNLPAAEPTPSPGVPPATDVPVDNPTAQPTALPTDSPTLEPLPPATPGPQIVYTAAGSLWLVDGEGMEHRLTSGGRDSAPQISPDGRWVLFARELPPGPAGLPRWELRVVGLDGSSERVLVRPEALPGEMGTPLDSTVEVLLDRLPYQVAWLPDSRSVAFNTRIEGGYGLLTKDDLWLADCQTGALSQFLSDGRGGTFAFSPDGAHLVLSTFDTVSMMDANGANRRTLVVFDMVNTASEYAYTPQPVWSPDGSYALVGVSSPEPFGPSPSANLWRLPLTGDAVLLGTVAGNFLFATMGTDFWSPDLTRIAHTQLLEHNGSYLSQLIVANADGSDPVSVAGGPVESANVQFIGWHPDSQQVVYSSGQPGEVYLTLGTEASRRLVPFEEASLVYQVHWLDSQRFVYVRGSQGLWDVRLGQLDGAHRTVGASDERFIDLDVRP